MKKSLWILPAIAACSAILPTQAGAQSKTQEVAVSDLDLADGTDQATLHRRIEKAVRYVCSSGERETIEMAADRTRCMKEARYSAHAEANVRIAMATKHKDLAQSTESVVVGRGLLRQ